ncbi:MAG: class I SAM-dependent methyltransferase [Bacteroidetes bacterium]|nr:class I SAM-dependent methyltransferase [Bacteroidota bacterium]
MTHDSITTHCPACGSNSWKLVFDVIDHSITKESFRLYECNQCTLRITMNAPGIASISSYYQSAEYISHSNTREGIINRLYQRVRKITLAQKSKLVRSSIVEPIGNLLDYGSGTGAFVAHMQKDNWKVIGVEPAANARSIAKNQFGVELLDLAAFAELPAAHFDVITLWHVLEHVHELNETLQHLRRLLKPEGRIFIAMPNYTSVDAFYFGSHWAAYDVPRHLYHFSPPAMRQLMSSNQLKVHAIKPMWFDSFYVAMLSTQYQEGRVNYLKSFWLGIQSSLKTIQDTERASSLIYEIGY